MPRSGLSERPDSLGQVTGPSSIELLDPPLHPFLLTVRVGLDGAKPPIMRRLQLRGDLTLDRVHDYLQAAMGWAGRGRHGFAASPDNSSGQAITFRTAFDLESGGEGTPEDAARLDQVLRAPGDELSYTYGDEEGWAHTIVVEQVGIATQDTPPAVCPKALRASPPEDIGGIGIWNALAAALRANPDPLALTGDLASYGTMLHRGTDPDEADLPGIVAGIARMTSTAEKSGTASVAAQADRLLGEPLSPALEALIDRSPPLAADLFQAIAKAAFDMPSPGASVLNDALRPWGLFLELAGEDGIAVTAAGWMSPAVCARLWVEGGLDHGIGKGNREQTTPELLRLRRTLTAAGLIRRHQSRLLRTKAGDRALRSGPDLAAAIGASLLHAEDEFTRCARTVIALLLAAGYVPDPPPEGWPSGYRAVDAFGDRVAELLTHAGFSNGSAPVQRLDVRQALEVVWLCCLGEEQSRAGRALPGPGGRWIARAALLG